LVIEAQNAFHDSGAIFEKEICEGEIIASRALGLIGFASSLHCGCISF
jgi:hypothetical protein